MMKVVKITLLSIVICALVGVMVLVMTGNFNLTKKSKLVFNKDYTLEEIGNIKIDVKSEDIEIEESNSDKIIVKIYATEENQFDVKVEADKTLSIKQDRSIKNVCFGICYGKRDIIIYLPKEYIGKINIDATSADITSKISNILDYKIDVTSGDIEIENANSLVGKATSGDVEVDTINSYIDFQTTSGDFEIGSIKLEKDSSIKVTSGDVDIDSVENGYIETSVKSGDVKIKNNDRHAQYVLSIKTTSGDITVK